MDCFHPVFLKDQGIYVRCGSCPACLGYRQQAWIGRLTAELQLSDNAYFVTFTYNDESLKYLDETFDFEGNIATPRCAIPCKRDLQLFLKRVRKFKSGGRFPLSLDLLLPGMSRYLRVSDSRMKYYIVSEYGPENLRPHYHGIFFNVDNDIFTVECLFRQCWPFGFIEVDECNVRTISYVTKYLLQNKLIPDLPEYLPRPFSLMSKGLGAGLLTPNLLDWWRSNPTNRVYIPEHGSKKVMSRYYKDKVFDDDMKSRIAEKYASLSRVPEYSPEIDHLQKEYVRQRQNLMLKKSKL